MPRLHLTLFAFSLCAGLAGVILPHDASAADAQGKAAKLARQILDDSRPEADRKKIITDHPELSRELLGALVADMPAHDSKEEYRRIPWIWRVAIAAAKRNDVHEMKPIVEFSLPQPGKPLRDWEAVVMGGGIINGIGLVGAWPNEQMEKMVAEDPGLRSRWEQTLELAAAMADNQDVFKGTRYDALRIIGVDSWDRRGAQLSRYLEKGVDDELQQGAIGGLGNMRSTRAAGAILSGFAHYNAENRGFALDALLKDNQRITVLLDAVEAGKVQPTDIGGVRIGKLKHSADSAIRDRARKLLARSGS